jgi:hypothetical protein
MQRAPAGHRGSRNRQQGDAEQSQHSLFAGLDEGRRHRDEGMATAVDASHPAARAAIAATIDRLASSGQTFTSDDVRAETQPLGSSPTLVGAMFAAAARAGTIRRVGFVQTSRPEAHGRHIAVWIGTGVGGAA